MTEQQVRNAVNRAGRKHREALYWVALNDDTATTDLATIASYISTCLVADLWYDGNNKKAAEIILYLRTA